MVLPALVCFSAELVVLFALFIIQEGADLCAGFLLNCLKSWLGFLAQLSKLAARLFADLVHFFTLSRIQAQIVIELIDVALRALRTVLRVRGITRTSHPQAYRAIYLLLTTLESWAVHDIREVDEVLHWVRDLIEGRVVVITEEKR